MIERLCDRVQELRLESEMLAHQVREFSTDVQKTADQVAAMKHRIDQSNARRPAFAQWFR